jgi:hypothetical protein
VPASRTEGPSTTAKNARTPFRFRSAERRACEIRLRAERKAGQLLAESEKAKGRPPANRSHDATDYRGAPTLADLGISKSQNSRYQQLAAVPEERFEPAPARP